MDIPTLKCTNCPADSNSTSGGITISSCKCHKNRYMSAATQHCHRCPIHSNTTTTGASYLSSCKCKPSWYLDQLLVMCRSCEPGRYTPAAGAAYKGACVQCPADMYCSGKAATNCPVNSLSNPGSVLLSECNRWYTR